MKLSIVALGLLSNPLANAKRLWSTIPASSQDIIRTAYPLGNGRLGAMPYGPPGFETINLNVDSLWSGGPFEVSNYTGGNPTESVASALPGNRDWIFQNGTGNVSELLGDDRFYGSYRVLGNLSVEVPSISNGKNASIEKYSRELILANGIHTTRYTVDGVGFETSTFCSFSDQVCVYSLNSTTSLPTLVIRLDNELAGPELQNSTCDSGSVKLRGVTQLGPPEGMRYEAIVRLINTKDVDMQCDVSRQGTLTVLPRNGTRSVVFVVGAGTNYEPKHGTSEHEYSFRGEDPTSKLQETTSSAASKDFDTLRQRHIEDFEALTGRFEFSLPDHLNASSVETSKLLARYNSSSSVGDPYLESLLFDYGKYLFISSSRAGSLPPNLQGIWSEGLYAAWSGDYHANINLQMNHWTADQIGLTDLQSPLWDYMEDTWVPRGRETAKLLYDAPGWVVHNEMNIFGHTGMKSGASWANYAAAAAWMMQHVWDHWEYSQNTTWLATQGYPLLKGVAEFWLSQLQEDKFNNDGTLVVNPCNSPEHGPTTFGCAHYQQLIHQIFDAVLSASTIISEPDTSFTNNISLALSRLDKDLHIGSFFQLKEWKIPDSFGYEVPNDTHRHLSELTGWYPGSSISSFLNGYTNTTVQSAVANKLLSRGNGNGADANAGWGKVWRAACWARLNDTEHAHFQLRYSIEQNFAAGNALSMYSARNTPFQIDANFGFGGAVLSMLVVDLPVAHGREGTTKSVVLGPAIPVAWEGGSVRGLRLRGGGSVDFRWDEKGLVKRVEVRGRERGIRIVDRDGKVLFEK